MVFKGDPVQAMEALRSVKSYIESDQSNPEVKNFYLTNQDNLTVNNQNCGSVYFENVTKCVYLTGRSAEDTQNAINSLLVLKESGISGAYQRYHMNLVVFPYKEYSKYSGEHDWREFVYKSDVDAAFLSSYELMDTTADFYLLKPRT